jgi:hypothetical protein
LLQQGSSHTGANVLAAILMNGASSLLHGALAQDGIIEDDFCDDATAPPAA